MRLSGKVILVVGGAGGIGRAVCATALREGATVVCADRSLSRAQAACVELDAKADRLTALHLDAGDAASWDAAIAAIQTRFSALHGLVTSFYSGAAGTVESMTSEAWAASHRATSGGIHLGLRSVSPLLKPGAAVVNIGSIAGSVASPCNVGYAAAKAAAASVSRSVAAAWARRGVRVNMVTPGLIATSALDATLRALSDLDGIAPGERVARIPVGEAGRPQDVAEAVVFLLSDAARYITGIELPVDGGLALRPI